MQEILYNAIIIKKCNKIPDSEAFCIYIYVSIGILCIFSSYLIHVLHLHNLYV